MKRYVIYKSTRAPAAVSYDGPAWDAAGIRRMRRDTYKTRFIAEQIARLLTQANGVGFDVVAVEIK